MIRKKGQIFHENIILWGAVTVLIIVVMLFSLKYLNLNQRASQANDVVKSLAITANAVHNLGRGSKDTVLVYVPAGVNSTSVSGNDIKIILKDGTVASAEAIQINAKVVGGIPKLQGYYHIPVRAINDEIVIIGNIPFIVGLEPDCIGVNQLSPGANITINGDGFQQGYNVYVLWPGGQLYQIDPSLVFVEGSYIMKFTATPINFFSNPNPPPFFIYVENLNGEFSNELEFDVMPSINQC